MNRRSGIESKQRIMKAAMDVFSRKGYAKANMREIAGAAGISIGGVYLYFRNKEYLYKSLIHEKMQDMGDRTAAIAERAQCATEALSCFLGLYLERALKHKEFILLHIREHGFTFGREEKKRFFRGQKKVIEEILQVGIDTGEFRNCNTKNMADIIMGSMRGIILSIALDGEEDGTITTEALKDFVLYGIGKRAKGAVP